MEAATHAPSLYSQSVKTQGKTYFFDVKAAKNGNKYLTITESRLRDGQKFRSTLTVFADHLPEFSQTVSQMLEKVK